MANPFKQSLSKGVSQMKFMKRLSHGTTATDGDGDAVLADKWVVPDAPQSAEAPKWPRVEHSYVEFENLNTLGRFSYNKYNREIEHLMAMFARDHQDTGTSNKDEEEEEGTITIQEMARRYETLSDRPRKLGKRKRSAPELTS